LYVLSLFINSLSSTFYAIYMLPFCLYNSLFCLVFLFNDFIIASLFRCVKSELFASQHSSSRKRTGMSGNEWLCSLIEIIHSAIQCLNSVMFYVQLTKYSTLSQFNNLWFIAEEVLEMPSLLNPRMHGHVLSGTATNLSRSLGGCEWLAGIKMHWWSDSSFPTGAECTRGFTCSHRENLKELGRANVGAVPRSLRTYIGMKGGGGFRVWGGALQKFFQDF